MSMSRKQALNELQNMFPDYDRKALNTLLRANGKCWSHITIHINV